MVLTRGWYEGKLLVNKNKSRVNCSRVCPTGPVYCCLQVRSWARKQAPFISRNQMMLRSLSVFLHKFSLQLHEQLFFLPVFFLALEREGSVTVLNPTKLWLALALSLSLFFFFFFLNRWTARVQNMTGKLAQCWFEPRGCGLLSISILHTNLHITYASFNQQLVTGNKMLRAPRAS